MLWINMPNIATSIFFPERPPHPDGGMVSQRVLGGGIFNKAIWTEWQQKTKVLGFFSIPHDVLSLHRTTFLLRTSLISTFLPCLDLHTSSPSNSDGTSLTSASFCDPPHLCCTYHLHIDVIWRLDFLLGARQKWKLVTMPGVLPFLSTFSKFLWQLFQKSMRTWMDWESTP